MNNFTWAWVKSHFGPAEPMVQTVKPCFWQTDLHSHLIPDVDDGVKTIDQAMECLRGLAELGIQKVITTPHISKEYYPNKEIALIKACETLREQVDREQLPIQIEVAAEYMLDTFFLDLLDTTDLLTFGPERYLLIETGWLAPPLLLNEMLFRIQTKGYIPVLAHPERYSYYANDFEALEEFKELGCLFQLNWMSLVGRYGPQARKQAQFLLKNGWIDFIGSDLHRPEDLSTLEALFSSSGYELLKQQPLRNNTLIESCHRPHRQTVLTPPQ